MKNNNSFELYGKLLRYTWSHKKLLMVSILFILFSGFMEASLSLLLKPILDQGFVGKDPQFIKLMPLLIIGAFLLMSFFSILGNIGMQRIAQSIITLLREKMFEKILNLPIKEFEKQPSGILLSKLTYDVNQMLTISSFALVTLIKDIATILGLLGVMLYADWKLSLMMFLVSPFIAIILRNVSKRLRRLSTNVQNEMGQLNHVVEEAIRGHKEIRIYGATEKVKQKFDSINHLLMKLNLKIMRISEISSPLTQAIVVTLIALLMFYAGNQIIEAKLTVGEFLSLLTAMVMLLNPIKRLTRLNEGLQKGLAGAASIFDLLEQPDENKELEKNTALNTDTQSDLSKLFAQSIHLKDISFAYDNHKEMVLKNINLEIKSGQTIALVGPSGSGKTTLAHLIARFYQPTSGKISLGEKDISEINLNHFRSQMAFVGQHVVLFADTVANNITFGQSNIDMDNMTLATKYANADEFIEKLPQKFDTLIGENGTRLSGGQRQRLAIARAFYKNAPLLILDEATSNLDNKSEFLIQESMEKLLKNRTTIIIAHRLSTIRKADLIVVLSKGEIIEQGTHQELINRDSVYAKLYGIGENNLI